MPHGFDAFTKSFATRHLHRTALRPPALGSPVVSSTYPAE